MVSKKLILAALSIALAAVGCTNNAVDNSTHLDEFLGKPLSMLSRSSGEGVTFIVRDNSSLVGKDPTYTPDQLSASQWSVIALCADQPSIPGASIVEVAIIPAQYFSASLKEKVENNDFSKEVACEGLTSKPR